MNGTRPSKAIIAEFPPLRVRDFFTPRIHGGLFKAFYGRRASLFYFGRGALWQAVKAMNLSASDNVLVPAFHCGVEIEAMAMTGAQLRFYDIAADFTIDLAELQSRFDAGTKALLLIHYFGFPQEIAAIKALCEESDVLLIEDCCHALFSSFGGKPLGTFGDASVFSQRKTLPLPDGGALVLNNSALEGTVENKAPSGYVALKKVAGMLLRSTFNLNPRNALPYPLERLAGLMNNRICKTSGTRYSTGLEIDVDRCSLASSELAQRLMDRTRIEQVIGQRRDNYSYLLRNLPRSRFFKTVRRKLPEGVCPLFFPIRIDGIARDVLQERLMNCGVGTFIFGEHLHPALPGGIFPDAELLSDSLLCLPVHQALGPAEMAFIVEALLRSTSEPEPVHADTF